MFIAHLPAGYLVGSVLTRHLSNECTSRHQLHGAMLFCLIGSILPDLDMFYFHLIDQRQHNHHSYWTHTPAIWLTLFGLLCFMTGIIPKLHVLRHAAFMLLAGVMTHLLLDTVAEGGIRWLYPADHRLLHLIDIPGSRKPRILNHLVHWSFLIELFICLMAIKHWHTHRRQSFIASSKPSGIHHA